MVCLCIQRWNWVSTQRKSWKNYSPAIHKGYNGKVEMYLMIIVKKKYKQNAEPLITCSAEVSGLRSFMREACLAADRSPDFNYIIA